MSTAAGTTSLLSVIQRPLYGDQSRIGYGKARELLLTGELLSAAETKSLGAIGNVVAEGELDAKVDALVAKVRHGATKAIRWTKVGCTIPLRQLAHGHMEAGTAYEC